MLTIMCIIVQANLCSLPGMQWDMLLWCTTAGRKTSPLSALNRLLGLAGRSIYHFLEWWNSSEVAERVTQHIPNGIVHQIDSLKNH